MDIIFYSPEQGQAEESLRRVIASIIPEGRTEIYHNLASLIAKLRQPKKDLTIVMLLTDRQDDLVRLLTVGDLFHNTRLIFIAPDNMAEANTLVSQRRIFGCLNDKTICIQGDRDFAGVSSVLNNIMADYQNHNGKGGGWHYAASGAD
jgi:hypothetical protein